MNVASLGLRPPASSTLVLANEQVRVELIPEKGFDIYSIVELASSTDLLFKTPWGWRDPRLFPPMGSSQANWLSRYPGGWQLLAPNAGDDTLADPGVQGFHGEAAIVPWTITEATPTFATAHVQLLTAPLTVTREVSLTGNQLSVRETIQNHSPVPIPFHWVHHPAFGSPFLGPSTRVELDAGTIVAEPGRSGITRPQPSSAWPHLTVPNAIYDLSQIPDHLAEREVFATLADFETGEFRLVNDERSTAFALAWDLEVFPYAWFWQEIHASSGFPWFKQAYVTAIEPSSVIPGEGSEGRLRRGRKLVLQGDAQASTTLVATVYRPQDQSAARDLENARQLASGSSDTSQLTESY